MPGKHDILSINDIKLLVNTFYDVAKQDDLIGPVFNAKIQDWDRHLNIMYSFWETVLLDAYTYKGTPFNQHKDLPINDQHFDRWIQLFSNVVDENFAGPHAENAKLRAKQFGTIFWSKMQSANH
jgi:hemoglobin